MKLNIFVSFVLLAAVVQQGESSITKTVVVKLLEGLNTLSDKLANEANEYFLGKLQNHTQIQEWSVDIQVKVVTNLAEAAFSVFNLIKNASIVDVKILDCIADQETSLLETLRQAASDNGWCNNRLAANLTYAFQGVTELMVDRNVEFKKYLDSFESCILGDDYCFTQYLNKIIAYVESEFGPGDTMLHAVEEVVRIYKIMFGQDVPACNEKYLSPEIADGIHAAAKSIFACLSS